MSGRVAYYGGIVKDGLILFLDAGKQDSYPRSGTNWIDISGFNNLGQLVNSPTFNSDNYGSILLDGTNEFVNLGIPTSMEFGNSGSYSFCYWLLKSSPFKNYDSILSMGQVANQRMHFLISSDGLIYRWNSFSTTGLTLNIWTNVVYTYNSSGVNTGTEKFYINGVETNSRTGAMPNWISTGDRWIGLHSFGGGSWGFNGRIATFMSYNRVLTSQEVSQNYNATKSRFGL